VRTHSIAAARTFKAGSGDEGAFFACAGDEYFDGKNRIESPKKCLISFFGDLYKKCVFGDNC
jgi:hypothetical protein